MNEPIAKYLVFERGPDKPRTKTWGVFCDKISLGIVAWCGPWRQYAFNPIGETVFEKQCLRDIANFCEYQTKIHKDKWRKGNPAPGKEEK